MMEYVDIEKVIDPIGKIPVIDVRSPSEYKHGHLPGAVNIPLFDDEERARVGKLYKNSGRDAATLLGLEIVGPKMVGLVKQARKVNSKNGLFMYCWRGGMRSASMAWLFNTSGLKVTVVKGGYKAYRKFIRAEFSKQMKCWVLGGMTGSGKTEILHKMKQKGDQVLDLENLANHKGSAFGAIGLPAQPTNEQFENDIYMEFSFFDLSRIVWVENESRSIGMNSVPEPLFKQMRDAPLVNLVMAKELRIQRLVKEYTSFNLEKLEEATNRIAKKLGGAQTKKAVEAIRNGDFYTAIDITLSYYDQTYQYGLSRRDEKLVFNIEIAEDNPEKTADIILDQVMGLEQNILKNAL